jgi:hypothetical protein
LSLAGRHLRELDDAVAVVRHGLEVAIEELNGESRRSSDS